MAINIIGIGMSVSLGAFCGGAAGVFTAALTGIAAVNGWANIDPHIGYPVGLAVGAGMSALIGRAFMR